MAAPWEDVRDVLVRVGFGSPRPSTSSDEIIRVTSRRGPRGRDDEGQRQAGASSSRRRRRKTRTSNSDTNSPMASMLDDEDTRTPLPRAAGSNSSTPADRQHRKVRISTSATNSRARNRARGVRPVHQSPSQLLLDLSPAIDDTDGARQQDMTIDNGGGGDDETAAALFAEALSPIVPIPRRTSSVAALSDYGEQTNGSDVDLSEVHDMVDQIQRDLTEDLREISTSIKNYDDNTNNNIANDDDNGDDGGLVEKAQGGHEDGTNGPGPSCADGESSVESSTSASVDSTGKGIRAKTIATTPQEREADQSAETLDTPPENDKKTAHFQLSNCYCMCECHEMPSPQSDVAEAEKVQALTPPKYKYPIPTRESADAPARALCQTADEIQRRAEVAAVLSCVIMDVEQAHWLTIDLRHRSEVTCLQNQLESAQKILSERQLVEQYEEERRKALGDRLLVELMSLGAGFADMGNYKIEMNEVTTENKRLSSQLASALDQIKKVEAERDDALAAALKDRTLIEIEEMKKRGEEEQKANVDKDWISLKNGSKEEPLELVEVQMPNAKEGAASVDEPTLRVKSTDFGIFVVEDRQQDRGMEDKSKVSKVKEEPSTEEVLPPMLVLPERGLMVLFSFLEAEEILSVAELNMLMYSRVDALFGLGGEASNQEEGPGAENNQDSDETHEEHLSAPSIVEIPPPPSGPDEGAGPGRPMEPREAAPRIGLAGQAQEGAHLIGSAVGNAVSQLLWQRNLQRERITTTTVSGSTSSLPTRDQNEISENGATRPSPNAAAAAKVGSEGENTTNHHQSSPPLLTASLASEIAAKLSPQEVSVIIKMKTKINQLEEELVKGKERQDDLMAELRGIEGVKDFLVSKLRNVERSKLTKIDDAETTAKQVASDQEVIGFLDNKVGELEMNCAKLSAEREQLKKELIEVRKEGKVRFLEDQIKLMRDEVADQGKQWKMEKKILVKEVKENRHKLAVLEAEKRGMQSELSRLNRELSSSAGHYNRSPKMYLGNS